MLLAAAALAWLVAEWNTPGAGAAFTPGLLLYAAWPALLAAAALRGLDERPFDRPSILVRRGLLRRRHRAPWARIRRRVRSRRGGLHPVPGQPRSSHGCARARALARSGGPRALQPSGPRPSPRSQPHASSAHRRPGGDGRRPCSFRPSPPWPCSPSMRSTASIAASCPTTRPIARCEWPRPERSRWSRPAWRSPAGVPAGRVRPWPASCSTSVRRRRPASSALARGLARRSVARAAAPPGQRRVDRRGGSPRRSELRSRARDDSRARPRRGGARRDPSPRAARRPRAPVRARDHRAPGARARGAFTPLGGRGSRSSAPRVRASCRGRREAPGARARPARRRAAAPRRHRAGDSARPAQVAADDPLLDARLAEAEEGVRTAVVQLRDVAHGLFPTVLADEGLRAALDELSERHASARAARACPTGVSLTSVESAAYFAAVESLRLTDATSRSTRSPRTATCGSGSTPGRRSMARMTQIRDRVGAVGGTVAVADGELRLEMPCES